MKNLGPIVFFWVTVGQIVTLIMLLTGCATAPGPWVYQDGGWCQSGTQGCTVKVKSDSWMYDERLKALNELIINANGVK